MSRMHWKDSKPQSVKITSNELSRETSSFKRNQKDIAAFCPFSILRKFIKIRPNYVSDPEPFFICRERMPIVPSMVNKVLKSAIQKCGIDVANYSMHGFRSGRSEDLLEKGISVETIRKLGRWKSKVVFTY